MESANETKTSRIKPTRLLILGAILLLLLWLGLKGWAINRAWQSLQAQQSNVEELLAGGLTQIDPDAAEAIVMDMRHDFVVIKRETAVFMPLTPYLEWVPRYGSTLAAAPALMEMADAGTETAVYAIQGFKPALALLQTESSPTEMLPELLGIVQAAQPELDAMSQNLNQLAAARADLDDTAALPWRIRTLLEQADPWLPLAQSGLRLAPLLPEMMGGDEPRSYLIIAQNEDELRPTGGFISGAGLLVMANGRIDSLTFQDAYAIDNWQGKPYDFPPQPLYDFMGLEMFLFRDANFWPDFPTSAEKLMALYSYGQDAPLPDGVIAIDQQFVQLLVEAVGEVYVSEFNQTLNGQNSIKVIQSAWAIQEGEDVSDWAYNRKDFLAPLAAAILAKLESADVDPLLLAQNLHAALQRKDLQIYLRNPEAAQILHQLNWDGRLPQNPQHDFLMLVDTNVGFSKANYVIQRQIEYQVAIADNGSVQSQLTATYNHTGEVTDSDCLLIPLYNLETAVSYQNLVNECYWNYLRLYAPNDSQLIDASSHTVPAEYTIFGQEWAGSAQPASDLTGLTTFGTYFLLHRSQQLTSYFSYELPDDIIYTIPDGQQYDLLIYKQAGTKPEPIQIVVQLPEGAQLITAQPTPTTITENRIYIDFDLTTNTTLSVQFK